MKSLLPEFSRFLLTLRLRRTVMAAAVTIAAMAGALGLAAVWNAVAPFREPQSLLLVVLLVVASIPLLVLLRKRWLKGLQSISCIARRVESTDRSWNDLLVTATDLVQRQPTAANPLQQEVLTQARKRLEQSDWQSQATLPFERIRSVFFATIGAVVLLALASLTVPARKAASQLAVTFGLSPAGIQLDPTDQEVPRHSDAAISIQILRWEPEAIIEFEQNGDRLREPVVMSTDGSGSFSFYSLSDDLRYRVSTPSLRSDWQDIRVYDPPQLRAAAITIRPPAYTGRDDIDLEGLQDLAMIAGSTVQFDLTADAATSAQLVIADSINEMAAGAESDRFTLSTQPAQSGDYRVELSDAEGRSQQSPWYELEVVPDRAPVVEILHPEKDASLMPEQELYLEVFASDDIGLARGRVVMALSGEDLEPAGILYPTLEDGSAQLESTTVMAIPLQQLGAQNGDILSLYVEVEDNREPEPNLTRTDLIFIEISSPIEPTEMDGMPMETREIDLRALISEQKRLLRETHRLSSLPESEQAERAVGLASDLSALGVEIRRLFVELEQDLYNGGRTDLIEAFTAAVEGVNEAIAAFQRQRINNTLRPQTTTLSSLVRIENALRQNIISEQPSEGESGEGSSSESSESDPNEQEQQDTLEAAREAIAELLRQQNALNSEFERAESSSWSSAQSEAAASQQAQLGRQAGQLSSALQRARETQGTRAALSEAQRHMSTASRNAGNSDAAGALRSGLRAREALRQAAGELESMLQDAVAREFQRAANAAADLANAQGEAAQTSRSAGDDPAANLDQMEAGQRELNQRADQLTDTLRQGAQRLSQRDPQAGQALQDAANAFSSGQTTSRMERAANALLYGQTDSAANLQEQAKQGLAELADNLLGISEQLAQDPQRRLNSLAQQLGQTIEEMASYGQNPEGPPDGRMERIRDNWEDNLGELQQLLGDPQFGNLAQAMAGSSEAGPQDQLAGAQSVLMQAAGLLQSYLSQAAAESGLRLNRDAAPPPDRYRQRVEEYFRRLATEPEK